MIQEDKQLLLKDLCARLPYHTKCYCEWSKEAPNGTSGCVQELSTFLIDELEIMGEPEYDCQISGIKPYLRPMSSITEEEKEYIKNRWCYNDWDIDGPSSLWREKIDVEDAEGIIDYFNAHHFDYRGLIEKGLALESPEDELHIKPRWKPSEEQMEALKKVTGNAVDADEYYPALATLYYDLKEQF